MNLALIGYRGTGKSHVAQRLAARLGWPALDADDAIELRAGRSIATIFAELKEQGFRDLETAVVRELTKADRQVLAMGGGVVLRDENRQCLAERCYTVWLTASPEQIAQRLMGDVSTTARRPSLTGKSTIDEIAEVLAHRLPLYQACADLTVSTDDLTAEEVAESVWKQLPEPEFKKER